MRILSDTRKCALFVGYEKHDGTKVFAGTAFLLGRREPTHNEILLYVVTARHVVEGIAGLGLDTIQLRTNLPDGTSEWTPTSLSGWVPHPESGVDVMVFPHVAFKRQPDHLYYDFERLADAEVCAAQEIDAGDDVFIAGLFSNLPGENRNIPIVRTGTIAAMPEEPIRNRLGGAFPAYLIESRSLGGLSGSPVFVNLTDARTIKGKREVAAGPVIYLLGLVHGHFDAKPAAEDDPFGQERINKGITIVVPANHIRETILQPSVANESTEVAARLAHARANSGVSRLDDFALGA